MKTMYQFIKNRQFFKITLERDYQEKCVTVHTRYQVWISPVVHYSVNTLQYACLAGCRLLDMFWDNEFIFLIYIPRNIRMLSDPSGGFSSPSPEKGK